MTPADLETVYEALAEQLDAVDAETRELYLAKLALLLAHEIADAKKVLQQIADAAENLEELRPRNQSVIPDTVKREPG